MGVGLIKQVRNQAHRIQAGKRKQGKYKRQPGILSGLSKQRDAEYQQRGKGRYILKLPHLQQGDIRINFKNKAVDQRVMPQRAGYFVIQKMVSCRKAPAFRGKISFIRKIESVFELDPAKTGGSGKQNHADDKDRHLVV